MAAVGLLDAYKSAVGLLDFVHDADGEEQYCADGDGGHAKVKSLLRSSMLWIVVMALSSTAP